MIDLSPPFYPIRQAGISYTVFRDHIDPDQFWVLPPRPAVAQNADETPRLRLVKYVRPLIDGEVLDARKAGAGFLQLETICAHSEETLRLLTLAVARAAERPEARLSAPVMADASARIVLAAASEEGRFVQTSDLGTPVSIVSPHRAAFFAALAPSGATLVERALQDDDVPCGLVYQFAFDGLLPALDATVRMDYDRVYERIAVAVSAEYQMVRAELTLTLAELIETDAIDIELTHMDASDPAARRAREAAVMALIQARIEQDFFRPGIQPRTENPNPLAQLLGQTGETGAGSAMFVLKARYELETELKVFTLDLRERAALRMRHVQPAHLLTLRADHALPVEALDPLDDGFFRTLKVMVHSAITFDLVPDLRLAVVHLTHHDRIAAIEFGPDSPNAPTAFVSPMADPGDDAWTWKVEYVFDDALGFGPTSVIAGPFESRQRVLTIHPARQLTYQVLRVRAGRTAWDQVPRLRVALALIAISDDPDERHTIGETELVLTEDQPMVRWPVRAPADAPPTRMQAQIVAELTDGRIIRTPMAPVSGRVLTVDSPITGQLTVHVQPASDPARVRTIFVTFSVEVADAAPREETLTVTPASDALSYTIPAGPAGLASWRWRETLLMADSTLVERPWQSGDRTLILVGLLPEVERVVKVLLLAPGPDVLAVQADFIASDAQGVERTVSALLLVDAPEAVVKIPIAPDGFRYRMVVKRFTEQAPAGEVFIDREDTRLLVIINPRATA